MGNRGKYFFFVVPLSLIIFFSVSSCGLFYYDDMGGHTGFTLSETDVSGKDTSVSSLPPPDTATSGNITGNTTYEVAEIIDGDTFILQNKNRVRLLGINTPETDNFFYYEARDMLVLLLADMHVMLEKDISDVDGYGRLLRYAYSNRVFINLEMVKRGFANTYTVGPDVRYAELFLAAERFARENELGLWKLSDMCSNVHPDTEFEGPIEVCLNFDAYGDDRKNLNGEYLTLTNLGDEDLNLAGWTVKDSGTNIYDFKRYILKKNSRIILFSGSGDDILDTFFWNSASPVWNNDHDRVYIRDKNGLLIGYLEY